MIKAIIYMFVKMPVDFFMFAMKLTFLPFQLIAKLGSHTSKVNYKPRTYKKTSFDKEADLWGLSSNDRKIAKQERMSPADYIEAEERDDDNLDYDD